MDSNPVFGNHDAQTLEQFELCLTLATRGALMADGHVGYIMPIGGVMAYKDKVSPVGVGFDIGCGNMAVKLDIQAKELDINKALDMIQKNISFGIGRVNDVEVDHELFEAEEWKAYPGKDLQKRLNDLARKQLGTVGSGNHFVDIFADEDGFVWIGVHFGSRGLGHKTASGFINLAQHKKWDEPVVEDYVLFDLTTELGDRYFQAMSLAGRYAYAGREWVCRTIAKELGAKILEEVHNHHNFAWKEVHDGEELVVVRKGSTPAHPGQVSFIGGSMGDDSYIVVGLDTPESKSTLYSTVHGAGRVMSRTQAAGKFKIKQGRKVRVSEGNISEKMMIDWLNDKGVILRGGGLDEAPHVYRRLSDVLEHHNKTIKVLHTLTPLGVVMAGEEEFDPYKD